MKKTNCEDCAGGNSKFKGCQADLLELIVDADMLQSMLSGDGTALCWHPKGCILVIKEQDEEGLCGL